MEDIAKSILSGTEWNRNYENRSEECALNMDLA
jgi:hypothetical protein